MRGVGALAGGFFKLFDAASGQLGFQVTRRIGELGEYQQLFLAVCLAGEFHQLGQLGIVIGIPVTALREHVEQCQ